VCVLRTADDKIQETVRASAAALVRDRFMGYNAHLMVTSGLACGLSMLSLGTGCVSCSTAPLLCAVLCCCHAASKCMVGWC
jgi:hypothetical protein